MYVLDISVNPRYIICMYIGPYRAHRLHIHVRAATSSGVHVVKKLAAVVVVVLAPVLVRGSAQSLLLSPPVRRCSAAEEGRAFRLHRTSPSPGMIGGMQAEVSAQLLLPSPRVHTTVCIPHIRMDNGLGMDSIPRCWRNALCVTAKALCYCVLYSRQPTPCVSAPKFKLPNACTVYVRISVSGLAVLHEK